MTKKVRAEIAAAHREIIRNGYVVTFCQYGCMVDHEYFATLEEMLDQIAMCDEVFVTVSVIGIRKNGRTLSPPAVEEVLRLVRSRA